MSAMAMTLGNTGNCRTRGGEATPLGLEDGAAPYAPPDPLLERYRADPIGLRQGVERQARRKRNAQIRAFFARFFV